MGILRKGIFGGFEGKTGPAVGRVVNGKNVISALPHPCLKPFTDRQRGQQSQFAMVNTFLSCFRKIIAIGFAGSKQGLAFAEAASYNFKRIISGVYPDYVIDYSKVVLNYGSLWSPVGAELSLEGAVLVFKWLPEAQSRYSQDSDRACFMVYSAAKRRAVIDLYSAKRSDLGYDWVIPEAFIGNELHCYVSFASADGKMVSNSVYLGTN